MSHQNEQIANISPTPLFDEAVMERLLPTHTPAMGFQSYEKLEGDSTYRTKQQKQFFASEIRNPNLDYPKIAIAELEHSIITLDVTINQAEHLADPVAAEAVQSSAAYHQIEMYWLMSAKKLNELAQVDPSSEAFTETAAEYQQLNELLYGRPSDEIAGQVYGEIFAQAHAKKLDARGQKILDELTNGTTLTVAGGEVVIPALIDKAQGTLPAIDQETLSELTEVLEQDTTYIREIVQDYWDDVITPRAKAAGADPVFSVEDMKVVFTNARDHLDPENKAGIKVEIMPDKSALSWDTPTMSIQIGENRSTIDSPTEMVAKMTHELHVHGGRTIQGLKSSLAVLGTGLYTAAKAGERTDYLTFEEGFATVCEAAIMGGMKWEPLYVSRYLACISAYEGMDFRQSFEINWRARVLMAAITDQPLTDAIIAREQKQAYVSTVRIKRGTPTGLQNGPVLTFNKDLAYLEGKLVSLNYLTSAKGDRTKIRRLFTAKFDPTNSTQDELVTRYGVS